MDFCFELVWPNPPRTMTKAEWKKVVRWLRICRKKIHNHIDFAGYDQAIVDAMLYGSKWIEIDSNLM